MFKTWDGENKQTAREIAMADFKSEHGAIFLPGMECRCINMALEMGVVTSSQKLYLVEQMRETARIIKAQMTRRLSDATFHVGELATLKLQSKVDFAYLDCIGSMDEDMYNWIKTQLIPNLIHPFRVSFCFNYAWRPEVPFLDNQRNKFDASKQLLKTSFMYSCDNDYRLATYLCVFQELFGNTVRFYPVNGKPCFHYNDNVNPMVLFTLESNYQISERPMTMTPVTKKTTKKQQQQPSRDLPTLLGEYPQALCNKDKMRGWKRSLTLYSRNMAGSSGKPEHFVRAVKMRLTKLGFDTSPLV